MHLTEFVGTWQVSRLWVSISLTYGTKLGLLCGLDLRESSPAQNVPPEQNPKR